MRVASILAQNSTSAREQIASVLLYSDLIELRLDFWQQLDVADIAQLRQEISLPVIFTLRKQSQGGHCTLLEPQRLSLLSQLAALTPDYLDLEFDTPAELVTEIRTNHPTVQLIGSYHDFTNTPTDLPLLWEKIYNPMFDIFKIATFAHDIVDTLRLLTFTQAISSKHRIISMAMGEYGQASRILAPIVGSVFTYGSVGAKTTTAPGQLTLEELTDVYHVHLLNRSSQIYALLGDPISQSPGHLIHNKLFTQLDKNAIYVKLRVGSEVLTPAMQLLRQLPFAGFSITMPHKEKMMAFLDDCSAQAQIIHTVNTIKHSGRQYLGFNTDGIAGADVLAAKMPLANHRILILGAGGSAKAIAHALLTKGAQITLCNRTLTRARTFVDHYGGQVMDFGTLLSLQQLPFDALINTLPAHAYLEQCQHWKIPAPQSQPAIAVDIVLKPLLTTFLNNAQTAGWTCVSGDALFMEQALRQQQIWFDLPDSWRAEVALCTS